MPAVCVACNELLERVARGAKHTCGKGVHWICSKCGQRRGRLRDHELCPPRSVSDYQSHVPTLCSLSPIARHTVPDSRWLDLFVSKLGFEHFNRLQLVDVNNLHCERPLNLVCANWEDAQLSMDQAMAVRLSQNPKISIMTQKWISKPKPAVIDQISSDKIEDSSGRLAALKGSFLDLKNRRKYGLMLPNVDSQSFAFDSSVWQTVQHCASQVSAFVSELKRTASTHGSVEALESLEQDRQILSYEEMINANRLPVIGGFGFRGLQVYYKSNLAYTPLHDEIGHCQAVNLMLQSSVGVAFWLGVHLVDMQQHFSKEQILNFMLYHDENCVFDMLRDWIDKGIRIWLCIQTPGTAVVSGTFNNPAHMVLTLGERVTQIAWNQGFSARGLTSCLEFWKNRETEFNTGASTRKIIPCLRLQRQGLHIGLEHELGATLQSVQTDKINYSELEFIECCGGDHWKCTECGDPIDLMAVKYLSSDLVCYECFKQSHSNT